MNSYTSVPGGTIRVGDHFRDARKSNVRTLRVDRLMPRGENGVDVGCVVVRQEHEGVVTHPNRPTVMTATRLLSKAFVRVEEVDA